MNFTTLATLNVEEIQRLFKYIEKFAPEGEDKRNFALAHIGNFFVDLTLEQQVELFNVLDKNDFADIHNFIKNNPSIRVNLDGDSKIKEPNGAEVKAKALETSYKAAKEAKPTSQAKQIINARELNCLKTVKEYPYQFEKQKMLKEYNIPVLRNLSVYEELESKVSVKKFLALVFEYFRTHTSSAGTFLEYVLYYLDVIRLDDEHNYGGFYINQINELLKYRDTNKK